MFFKTRHLPLYVFFAFIACLIATPSFAQIGLCRYPQDNKDAIEKCTIAIDSKKYQGAELAEIYGKRASAYAEDDWTKALADYNEAAKLAPDDLVYRLNRGVLRGRAKEYDAALEDLDYVLQRDPKNAKAYDSRSEIKRTKGDARAALIDSGNAVNLEPLNADYRLTRAFASEQAGELALAIADLTTALELAEKHYRAFRYKLTYWSRAKLYSRTGDFVRALADVNELFAYEKYSSEYFAERCWLLAAIGNPQSLRSAQADCDFAVKRDPFSANALKRRAFLHFRSGRYKESLSAYNAALDADHDYVLWLYGRGLALQKAGESSKSERDMALARTIDPDIANKFDEYFGVKPVSQAALAQPPRPKDMSRKLAVKQHAVKTPTGISMFSAEDRACSNHQEDASVRIENCTKLIRNPQVVGGYRGSVFFTRGLIYFSTQQYDAAIADFIESGRIGGKRFTLAWAVMVRKGEFERALQHAYAGIEEDSYYAQEPLKARAKIYHILRQYDFAIADLSEAIRVEPRTTEHFASLDMKYDEETSRRVLAELYGSRGEAFLKKKDFRRAVDDLNQAIKYGSSDAETRSNLCRALLGSGDTGEAEKNCDAALAMDPANSQALNTRAFIRMRKDRHADALKDYALAEPKAEEIKDHELYGRGLVKLRLKDQTGQDDITAAKALNPDIDNIYERAGIKP